MAEQRIDIALLDATFYSPDELPDRDVTKIKHPLVTDSMDLLEPLVKAGRLRVYFTHMNHSNSALDHDGGERLAENRDSKPGRNSSGRWASTWVQKGLDTAVTSGDNILPSGLDTSKSRRR